jgi:hypothetical protein
VRISYVPFRKIEVERNDQWLHRQSLLQPFAVNAPQKGDRTDKFARNPIPAIFWTQPSLNQYFREIDAS